MMSRASSREGEAGGGIIDQRGGVEFIDSREGLLSAGQKSLKSIPFHVPHYGNGSARHGAVWFLDVFGIGMNTG